jgi:hypothetical protein
MKNTDVSEIVHTDNGKTKSPTNVNHVIHLVDGVGDQVTTNVEVVMNQDIYKKNIVLIHVLSQEDMKMILQEPVLIVITLVKNVPTVDLVIVSSVMKVIS